MCEKIMEDSIIKQCTISIIHELNIYKEANLNLIQSVENANNILLEPETVAYNDPTQIHKIKQSNSSSDLSDDKQKENPNE